MSAQVSVCVVTGSARPNETLPAAVAAIQAAGALVSVIAACLGAAAVELPSDRIVDLDLTNPLPLPTRLLRRAILAGSPAARRTWHAIRRDARARALLSSADVIVALDSAAIRAVWSVGNARGADDGPALVLGVSAAVDAVRVKTESVSPAIP